MFTKRLGSCLLIILISCIVNNFSSVTAPFKPTLFCLRMKLLGREKLTCTMWIIGYVNINYDISQFEMDF